jgi:hypothetical protein
MKHVRGCDKQTMAELSKTFLIFWNFLNLKNEKNFKNFFHKILQNLYKFVKK